MCIFAKCKVITLDVSLWGIEVPVGAPRFWPDHGISWEFFLALYMYEKHWETIFFHFGACHFVPFDI